MLRLLPLFALLLAAPAVAQDKDDDKDKYKFREDPYTEEEGAWEAAGYFGKDKFDWGDGHSTVDIDAALGGAQVVWLETEHFKIGVSLGLYTIDVNSKEEKAKIREELKELRKILPEVPAKPKKLDRWLQAHLWAMRLEAQYDQIEELLGVTPEMFPTGPGQTVDGKYMGEGPYLGMKSKFLVLLFDKESAVGRYRQRFMNQSDAMPIRHLWPSTGSMLFACARENPGLQSDTTMHCMTSFALTMNLVNAYKFYTHELPAWLPTGLAHWYARQINEKRNYFTEDKIFAETDKDVWNWGPRVRARVDHEYFPTMAKMFEYTDPISMKYIEHMMAWSRVDYLMATNPEGLSKFIDLMTGRLAGKGVTITREVVLAKQPEAFTEAFGITTAEQDEAWAEWVMKNYKKR